MFYTSASLILTSSASRLVISLLVRRSPGEVEQIAPAALHVALDALRRDVHDRMLGRAVQTFGPVDVRRVVPRMSVRVRDVMHLHRGLVLSAKSQIRRGQRLSLRLRLRACRMAWLSGVDVCVLALADVRSLSRLACVRVRVGVCASACSLAVPGSEVRASSSSVVSSRGKTGVRLGFRHVIEGV
ncbi:hypothetical protein C8Q73DRAFT_699649 [Cubamyces lactineus]|nr:hypothetical protein C8Q73DRAFT_699649 [Cubamyces lactineus]